MGYHRKLRGSFYCQLIPGKVKAAHLAANGYQI